ncbi:MAG: PEGA domain-containing protein [Myxococcales bacterium]|nr:PEGA domain-containing protein [Myxococcales bacterium]
MADDKKQKTLFLDDAGGAAPRSNTPSSSSQSTMMLDAQQQPAAGQRHMVVPTMMKQAPRQQLPPLQRPPRPSTVARWIAGPIVAALVAGGTVFAANAIMPLHKKGAAGPTRPQGKLRLNTEPPGASILVDGKRFPRFTPALVDGDVGSTLHLTFSMDGFKTQEAEVAVFEGEHQFNVHLQPSAAEASPPAPEPAKKEHHEHHATAAKEPVGEATLSVLVRPWAIVFVDHQRLKQTPVQGYKLPSGKHVVELVNEGKNRREKIDVSLKAGEEQEIKRDWDK